MKIIFNDVTRAFRPWKPEMGQVFARTIAFDCETTLIDIEHPWRTPAYVIGAAYDGGHGVFVTRADVTAFFEAHTEIPVVFHNAPFDLSVINVLAPAIDIYKMVAKNRVWDTQLLHRLYTLGAEGHVSSGKGQSTLEQCVETYLSIPLPKEVKDSDGDVVRLSYGKWLGKPLHKIEPIYLEYLAKDAIATRQIYKQLSQRLDNLHNTSNKAWGFVSRKWLIEQVARWGPQTHHIHLCAAIVLNEITGNGLHLDVGRREELARALTNKLERQRKELRKFGYLPGGEGTNKSLQSILQRLECRHRGSPFLRTPTGKYATSYDMLQDLADNEPFIKLLLEYRETEKLLNSFVGKMAKPVLHPSFNVLTRTGRTSSFGEINAQNLPTDDCVRSCFVPSDGYVFIDADYTTIELATLAQACVGQLGLDSKMADAINAKKDLHRLVAARVLGKKEADVSDADRKKAKPINFGKPGGMGDTAMQQYAKVSYGVQLTDAEVKALSDAWFALFPEMQEFLTDVIDTPMEVAKLLKLTPASHCEHTDDGRFARHPDNVSRERRPNRILGCMGLKVFKEPNPKTREEKEYSTEDIDYFWSRLKFKMSLLPPKHQQDILLRRPSVHLQRAVMSLVGRAGVFTYSGRLRANAGFCARHNTIFQGLAADGAKLALWLLWRAGYRIVNFVHDQVVVEVPAGDDLKNHAKTIRRLMIDGMKALVPDIHIDVKYAASDRWYKNAEAVFDKSKKRLLLWEPQKKEKATPCAV